MPSYVIVGASRGLGYQYLRTLSQNPSNTIIGIVRTPAPTIAKVQSDGLKNVHVLSADLTSSSSLNHAAEEASKLTNGVVDYLILNGAYVSASTGFLGPTDFIGNEKLLEDELATSISTNVTGVLYAINAFLPQVKKSPVKRVTVISTGMADWELTMKSLAAASIPYALSKAAVNLLVAKYAVQFKDEGIIFLALSPGVVHTATESIETMPPEIEQAYEALKVYFRRIKPDFEGPMLPEQSVRMCLDVIDKVTIKDSGDFISHHGNKEWL